MQLTFVFLLDQFHIHSEHKVRLKRLCRKLNSKNTDDNTEVAPTTTVNVHRAKLKQTAICELRPTCYYVEVRTWQVFWKTRQSNLKSISLQ